MKASKEIYDRLVGMFKVSNANQILFLKNKLKDIKKGKDEDIQFISWGLLRSRIIYSRLEKSFLTRNLPSPPLEDSHLSGIYLEPLFSIMIEF